MRGSLAITVPSENRVKSCIDANKVLTAQMKKLHKAKSIKLAQLQDCLTAVRRCNEAVDRKILRPKEAQRMVEALAEAGATLHRQDRAQTEQTTGVLTQIKQEVQALLEKDILCQKEKAQAQKYAYAVDSACTAEREEAALIAGLDRLAGECIALRMRALEREFEQRVQKFEGQHYCDAWANWLAANTQPFEDVAALERFPFDGPSPYLERLPLGENHSAGSGEPRRVPFWGMPASNWKMIGMLLKEREALRQELFDAKQSEPLNEQAQKAGRTRARDKALLPYMVSVNEIATKQKLQRELSNAVQ